MERKYFKPKSLTWWTGGAIPLATGVFLATAPLHGLATLTLTVTNLVGDIPPSMLIIPSLTIIGLRGKDG